MSETTLIWLFGIIGGVCSGLFVMTLRNGTTITKIEGDLRLMAVLIGKGAVGLLHSPDNHHGLDEHVEKFQCGSLSDAEMQVFFNILQKIEADPKSPPHERTLATSFLLTVEFKGQRYQGFNLGDRAARKRDALK